MNEEIKDKLLGLLESFFVSGETYMIVLWAVAIISFIMGAIIF